MLLIGMLLIGGPATTTRGQRGRWAIGPLHGIFQHPAGVIGRSSRRAYKYGVGDGIRTRDVQIHSLALYQLSYTHHNCGARLQVTLIPL